MTQKQVLPQGPPLVCTSLQDSWINQQTTQNGVNEFWMMLTHGLFFEEVKCQGFEMRKIKKNADKKRKSGKK